MPPINADVRRRTPRRAAVAGALLTVVALAAGGCSSSDSSSPTAEVPSASGSAAGDAQMASTVVIGKVAGTLHRANRQRFVAHRQRLERQVGGAVDGWLDGGFVGVGYPRDSFPTAFRTFSPGARAQAQHDRRLMTLWTYRHRIDGLTTLHRVVAIDVLAPKGRPVGATARVDLRFRTHGDVQKRIEVRGRLFLSRTDHGGWQVFGYDVTQGTR